MVDELVVYRWIGCIYVVKKVKFNCYFISLIIEVFWVMLLDNLEYKGDMFNDM